MRTYVRIALVVLAVSAVGEAIDLLFVHPRLYESDPGWSTSENAVWILSFILSLPILPLALLVDRLAPFSVFWSMAVFPASAILWSAIIFLARFLWRRITEPLAPPNAGSANAPPASVS